MSRGYRVLPYEAGSELTVTQDEGETEEEEGDRILKEVLDEIGVSVEQSVRSPASRRHLRSQLSEAPSSFGVTEAPLKSGRVAVGVGGDASGPPAASGGGGPGLASDFDDLQARLDSLRKD